MNSDERVRQLRLRADYLKQEGLDYALDPPRADLAATDRRPEPRKANASISPDHKRPGDAAGDEAAALEAVRERLGDCKRCPLHQGRTNLVFGVGAPHARLIFVGEGPGADEDAQGVPFVGRAGRLLTDIITKGMGLRREDVYIANVVKCRPPKNRNPLPEEMATCFPFLDAQIQAIRPEVIVALGKIAASALMGYDVPIMKMRGCWQDYKGVALMPTLHPS